jgi:hypothetical protein
MTDDFQTIDVRAASGGVEYTWPLTITETTGKDISGDLIQLSLGRPTHPGTWTAPDLDTTSASKASRTVQLLITAEPARPSGIYYLWSRITDSPEIAPRRHQRIDIRADPT